MFDYRERFAEQALMTPTTTFRSFSLMPILRLFHTTVQQREIR